ncbi:MAG: DUF1493 family protein [Candidatus Obscuribacterales bacterium]|nr:DUF1493 family protein [Candidatus Obscuribacterales bacterium]
MSSENSLYAQIVDFVCREIGVSKIDLKPNTRLYHDLGIDGDDAENIMASFAQEFQVDLSEYDHNLHFGPEQGFCLPIWFSWLLAGKLNKRGQFKKVPITILDLEKAAETKVWPIMQHKNRT